MVALGLILCAASAALGVTVITAPARAHDFARLFLDKAGMWAAAGIRAVFGLCLIAAAGESKAPLILKLVGLVILLFGIATPFLGLDRHRRLVDWWLARPRTMQIFWGAMSLVLGIVLIYLIL